MSEQERAAELERRELALERDRQLLQAAGRAGAIDADCIRKLLVQQVSVGRTAEGTVLTYRDTAGKVVCDANGDPITSADEIVKHWIHTPSAGKQDHTFLLTSNSEYWQAAKDRREAAARLAEGGAPQTLKDLMSLPPELRIGVAMGLSAEDQADMLGEPEPKGAMDL